ncbi:hypothetical protein H4S00_003813 [Coemansia sp. D1744]|nr:hypothetical protein H4S00_003813 [Coemansia sp. D1744]
MNSSLILNCKHLVRRAQTLHIKTHTLHSNSIQAVIRVLDCLPRELNKLHTITIESNERCTHSEGLQNWGTCLYMPVLATINVVYNSEFLSDLPMLAPILAHTIARCAGKQTGYLEHNMYSISYPAVAPVWIDCGQSLTTLVFTNTSVFPSATHAIRLCCKTLETLKFQHCSSNEFAQMMFNKTPIEYPKLRFIQGALSQPSSPVFIPRNVFPCLERVHEVAFSQPHVVPHLLVNTLMGTELPKLQEIVVQMSGHMDLRLNNVPSLRRVRYGRGIGPTNGRDVVGQLERLFMVRSLRCMRFYDHVPSVHVTSRLCVACVWLEYLDVGTIVLSLQTVVHVLESLCVLHSLKCALSRVWTASGVSLELGDCLSRSVRLLRVYMVGQAKGVTPVDEIIARLPKLTHVQVQEGAKSIREFVTKMKLERKFSWSARVSDLVHIETISFA